MTTTYWDLHPGIEVKRKTHEHCKSPGCFELATCVPHEQYPNVRFCDKHAQELLRATIRSIVDGSHPELEGGE